MGGGWWMVGGVTVKSREGCKRTGGVTETERLILILILRMC